MSIPSINRFLYPFLKKLENGNVTMYQMRLFFIDLFKLTEKDLTILTRKRKKPLLDNRIKYASVYLKEAGLILKRDGVCHITPRGKNYLQTHSSLVEKDLRVYPEYEEFRLNGISVVKPETEPMELEFPSSLTSNGLVDVFNENMKSIKSYELIGKVGNPCHLLVNGVEYYVYIKNISSAYFSNPDVSRAQLTGVDALHEIKTSDAMFLLLGYDVKNDVYAAWNPYMAKQRIDTAASPSFYSRFSWQKETAEKKDFISRELKNDGNVLLFPSDKLSTFMSSVETYFTDDSDYVALGSKKRGDANAAYKLLNNSKHLDVEFADYLSKTILTKGSNVQDFVWAIKHLITQSLFSSNRKIFLAYNSIAEYKNAVEKFISLDVIKQMDALKNGLFSRAMSYYIDFLIDTYDKRDTNANINQDYEAPFIDAQGNLTRIANPKLLDLLKVDLDNEFPSYTTAYTTIEKFYGNRFPNMKMHHWQALFNQINWSNPYEVIDVLQKNKQIARKKLSVTFPDGKVICNKKVVDTLLDVVKYAGVENVRTLGITMGKYEGRLLITDVKNPKYPESFKYIDDGLYVNTCSNTETKFSQLNQINERLGLKLKIDMI